jgi:phage shock protein A
MEQSASETVMREALREVERAMDDARSELGRAIARHHHAQRNVERMQSKLDELMTKADFAVEQSRDDLAQAVIARQIDIEAQIPMLQKTVVEAQIAVTELEQCMAALSGRKSEMESDLAAYQASKSEAAQISGAAPVSKSDNVTRRSDIAQKSFDRALNGATGVTGVSKADRDTAAKLSELDRVQRQAEIAQRLAKIKQQKSA